MLAAGLLLLVVQSSWAQRGPTTLYRGAEVSANTVVVQLLETRIHTDVQGQAASRLDAARDELGARVTSRIERKNIEEWTISSDLETALTHLNAIPGVKAYPNYMIEIDEPVERRAIDLQQDAQASWQTGARIRPKEGGATRPVSRMGSTGHLSRPEGGRELTPIRVDALGATQATAEDTLWFDGLDDLAAVDQNWATYDAGNGDNWTPVDLSGDESDYAFLAGDLGEGGSYADETATFAWPAAFDLSGLNSDSSYVVRFVFATDISDPEYDEFYVILYDENYDVLTSFNFTQSDANWYVGEIDLTPYIGMDFVEVDFALFSDETVSEGFGAVFDEVALVRTEQTEQPFPDDPFYSLLWGLHNDGSFDPGYSVEDADIDAPEAWELTTGSRDVAVVVFDTGIDYTHPDLVDNMWVNPGEDLNGDGVVQDTEFNGIDDDGNGYVDDFFGWDPGTDSWDIMDQDGHGTHVAGTIGAVGDNGVGVVGVNHNVSIIGVDILNGNLVDILEAYEYVSTLLADGVPIVSSNQSWGFTFPGIPQTNPDFVDLVNLVRGYALEHHAYGMAWVCSAGNDAFNNDEMPGFRVPASIQAPNIISVGATDSGEFPASFTSFGQYTVDVGAPGVNVASTVPGGYAYFSGTSMASPHVAGAVALASTIHPDDDVLARVARVMATSDRIGDRYGDLWHTGGRLNVNNMIAPGTTLLAEADVVLVGETGLLYKAYGDVEGVATVGFVNTSGAAISVTGAAITGPDADAFGFFDDPVQIGDVPAEGAFGLPLVFTPTEEGRRQYDAVLTLTTSSGDITIDLDGLDQPVAVASISPEFEDAGGVPQGVELESTVTLSNDGDFPLTFFVGQGIVADDEEMDALVGPLKTFQAPERDAKTEAGVVKVPTRAEMTALHRQVQALSPSAHPVRLSVDDAGDGSRATFLDDPNLGLLYQETFDDGARFDTTWMLFDNSGDEFVDPSHDNWERVLIDDANQNYAMVAGDLEAGLENGTWTVLKPPTFDFTALETGRRPYYLAFDYMIELDGSDDRFYIYAFGDGEFMGIFAHTASNLTSDGEARGAFIDISSLAGLSEVDFYISAYYDEEVQSGFGSLFDNFALLSGDAEFFANTYAGTVEPGSSQDITVSVRTGLLPEGTYSLFTDFYTLAVNAFFLEHELVFDVQDAELFVDPAMRYIEEPLGRTDTDTSRFSVTNVASEAVSFDATAAVIQLADDSFFSEGGSASSEAVASALEAVRTARLATPAKEARSSAGHSHGLAPGLAASALDRVASGSVPEDVASQVAAPAAQFEVLFYEDFQDSLGIPLDWIVIDESLGEGSVWHVENIGTAAMPQHVAAVGDLQSNPPFYRNNTSTTLVTPTVPVSALADGEALFLEFDYALALEKGYDEFSVGVAELDADGNVVGEIELIDSEEDIGASSHSSGRALLSVKPSPGVEYLVFGFHVETDGSVNQGFAFVDNVLVFRGQAAASVSPEEGQIAAGATEPFELAIDPALLYPGRYVAGAVIDYALGEREGDTEHIVFFEVANEAPVAEDDVVAVVVGDQIRLDELADLLLSNDADADGDDLWVSDHTEPMLGEIKQPFFDQPPYYVAPNTEGEDVMQYTVTDGFAESAPATVTIQVHAFPQFVTGSEQNYAMLEDDSLTLNTMRMASGVGGMDPDVIVWAEASDGALMVTHHAAGHTLTFAPDANVYGQFDVTLYVGHEGDPTDSMDVSVVVAPVNDVPVADFEFDVDGPQVSFTSTSSDALDPEGHIVSYEWAFADGATSTEEAPTHSYSEVGEYEVELTVTDNAGATATVVQTVEVTEIVGVESEEVPTEFVLDQNYPNPFNPATTIRFGLPEAQSVTLRVYNALGQVVHTLYDGTMMPPGYHDVSVDASDLASGIYLYQLEAIGLDGSRRLLPAKKMVLVK